MGLKLEDVVFTVLWSLLLPLVEFLGGIAISRDGLENWFLPMILVMHLL
jgi:hypothetical protein